MVWVMCFRGIVKRAPLQNHRDGRRNARTMTHRGSAATKGQLKNQPQTDDRMNRIYRMDSAFGRQVRRIRCNESNQPLHPAHPVHPVGKIRNGLGSQIPG